MNDEQQQPEPPQPRKPGFFSRLFTAKEVEAPPEGQPLSEEYGAVGVDTEADDFIEEYAGPEGFATMPGEEAPEDDKKKRGMFARFFGRKEGEEGAEEGAPSPEMELPPLEAEAPEALEKRKNWFQRLRERLRSGSGSFVASIRAAIGLSGKLDEDTIESIEDILVASDVSMDTTMKIVDRLKRRAKEEKAEGADAIMHLLKETLQEVFMGNAKVFQPKNPEGPYVVMAVGVNGVGKTTTLGKIAKRCRDAGLSVMLVAGDTFRAAAIEQLEIWAKRTGCDFMKSKMGADPSGLVFDALKAAKARNVDVVLIDTAGRLHTKSSLMEELGKIERVCKKVLPDAPHETLLVLDATTGQNAVQQVKIFSQAANITGLVMTKLDGTAKGGILITIRDQFEIPVTLIGVGEGVDDLRDFDPEQFAAAMFEEEEQSA